MKNITLNYYIISAMKLKPHKNGSGDNYYIINVDVYKKLWNKVYISTKFFWVLMFVAEINFRSFDIIFPSLLRYFPVN